jgi:NAD(P)-dependent dehydrogenase (short-subunit alcohol dehydrogenase family)
MSERRVAVVTGGAGAIGGAIAGTLADQGYELAIIDRESEFACDLSSEAQAREAARTVLARLRRCDVLVHAAAAFEQATLAELDLETWRRVQAVNVESILWLCQELTPGMVQRGSGRVVMIVSDTVWRPPAPQLLPYVASKAALIGIARSLAAALGPNGVTVNCVAPGLTSTPAARAGMPPEVFDDVRARQALPRTLEPADVAGAVAFLASDAAAAITGQTLNANGGLTMR